MPVEPGQVCAATVEPSRQSRGAGDARALGSESRNRDGLHQRRRASRSWAFRRRGCSTRPATRSELSDHRPSAGRWQEHISGSFTAPLGLDATEGYERMTMRVTLEAVCDGGSRQVHAVTDVHLCLVENQPAWASSGQSCCVCRIIAEMAPSPIVPDKHADELPLAQALRLRIVELARVSNTIVLLAENDGGEGLEYTSGCRPPDASSGSPTTWSPGRSRRARPIRSFRPPSTERAPRRSRALPSTIGRHDETFAASGFRRARKQPRGAGASRVEAAARSLARPHPARKSRASVPCRGGASHGPRRARRRLQLPRRPRCRPPNRLAESPDLVGSASRSEQHRDYLGCLRAS